MSTVKNLGIWTDHANAHLIECTIEPMETTTMDSKFTHQVKEESVSKSESLMHHKEQHEESELYNNLGDVIKDYESVILFGPTDAKSELYNILHKDHHFSKIKNLYKKC